MERRSSMSNMYLSHEHLDAVMADYIDALQEYWIAKENLGQAQYERDSMEVQLFENGHIYNQKEKDQGTNETSRKMYANTRLSGKDAIVQMATVALQRAEAQYEVFRKELEAFRLHLQLQGLMLKEKELTPEPAILHWSGPLTFFDEMVPFDETDYEKTLRIIREMMEQEQPGEEE